MSGWPKFNFSMSRIRGSSIRAINPRFPYSNAGLDLAFVLNRYALQGSPMSTYTSLAAFLAGIGGTFTRASSGTYFDATGTLQTAASNVPRLDYNPATLAARGYLCEEARTNSIRNSTMVGAVAGVIGSGGAAPTNWTINFNGNAGTCVANVVGTGTENGINYIDVQFNGLPTGSGFAQVVFETSTGITAANGDSWAASFYTRVLSGSTTNITTPLQAINEYTAAGAFVTNGTQSFSLAASTLATGRAIFTRTLSGGGTVARVSTGITFSYSALAINITFRIGIPQLELVPSATSTASSPILTTSAAVARATDVMSIPTSLWYNASAGTFFGIGVPMQSNNGGSIARRLVEVSDGIINNRVLLGVGITALGRFLITSGGATQADISNGTCTANAAFKMAGAYAVNDFQQAVAGTLGLPDISGAVPTSINNMTIGCDYLGTTSAASWNGWIERIGFIPSRVVDATLQSIST
jgi:hypothetical protein